MPIGVDLPEPANGSRNMGQPVPLWMLVISGTSVLFTAAIFFAIYMSGSKFEELFSGFGAELPAITRVVIATYKFYGVFLLVGLVPTVVLIRHRACLVGDRSRFFIPVIVSLGMAIFFYCVFLAGMYAPVFEMGTVVQ